MNDFGKIKQALAGILAALHSQALLNKLGLAQIRNIKDRTRRGFDLDNKPFRPYSEAYAERKERVHRIPADVVNLTLHDIDGMLQRVDHVVNADFESVEIMITDPAKRKIASYHNELGAGKSRVIRKFWGISSDDEKKIGEIVEEDLNLILQKLTD